MVLLWAVQDDHVQHSAQNLNARVVGQIGDLGQVLKSNFRRFGADNSEIVFLLFYCLLFLKGENMSLFWRFRFHSLRYVWTSADD